MHVESKMSEVPACFQGKSLYEIFEVAKDAPAELISKSYRKIALKHHPDRNQSPDATDEFAYLAKAHSILTDDSKRKLYDRTGNLDDSNSSQFTDAYEYFKGLFGEITSDDVENFRAHYVDGAEELEDLVNAYRETEGSLRDIMDRVPLSDSANVRRLAERLNALDEVQPKFTDRVIVRVTNQLKRQEELEARQLDEQKSSISSGIDAMVCVCAPVIV